MSRIHQLPPELIAKIAAGEVIERPAYALKELIENSLDAGATYIKTELENAGLDKISITDNGHGMSIEDMLECYKPHTTSKISNENDLFSIQSMGFRGEALASLASISEMSIRSKTTQDTIGNEIKVISTHNTKPIPFGMPTGTQIIIEKLFHNVPPRKKFLETVAREFRLILEMITSLSLTNPSTGFYIAHNKKKILELPQNQDLLHRTQSLFGSSFPEQLLPVIHEDSYISITGFIAKPQLSTQSGSKQYVFINNRKIIDKTISSSIKDTYGTLLEAKSQPVFILYITLPYERVDVNVHPRKEEVAFAESDFVLETIKQAVKNTLSNQNLIYNDRRWKKGEYTPPVYNEYSVREGGTSGFVGSLLKDRTTPWTVETEVLSSSDILQLHNLYLITQTKNGIILIDQHAAHERILYEQFLEEFNDLKKDSCELILAEPQKLDISISEKQILREHISEFKELGFNFDIESDQIIAVPRIFSDRSINELVKELLEDYVTYKNIKEIDSRSHKMLAYLACRTAIKAGDSLTKEQARNLIEKLKKCNTPYTCPHGRPTQIEITLNKLHQMFHRK